MRVTCEIIVVAYERDRTIIFRQQVNIIKMLLDLLVLVVLPLYAFSHYRAPNQIKNNNYNYNHNFFFCLCFERKCNERALLITSITLFFNTYDRSSVVALIGFQRVRSTRCVYLNYFWFRLFSFHVRKPKKKQQRHNRILYILHVFLLSLISISTTVLWTYNSQHGLRWRCCCCCYYFCPCFLYLPGLLGIGSD